MNTGKAVLVTGASTGIGRATALLLDSHGFTVFAGVRKKADAESLAAAASDRLVPLMIDVIDAKQVAAAAAVISESGLPLVGLVNNAGMAAAAPLEFIPIDEFRNQIEINLIGQLAVTQSVLSLLRESKGRIVNVTSIGGLIASSMLGAYNASKFALEAVTHTLRQELKPWGIEVIAIEPGRIATPIWSTASTTADRMLDSMPPEAVELYGPSIQGARDMAAAASKGGLAPERVAEVIEKALTVRRPRTRYPVGTDAKLGAVLMARLPDRTRDRLLSRI